MSKSNIKSILVKALIVLFSAELLFLVIGLFINVDKKSLADEIAKPANFSQLYKDDRIYYQVSATVLDSSTFAREIAPLKKIPDHYAKYIISMDEISMSEDGIKQINIIDFLLQSSTV